LEARISKAMKAFLQHDDSGLFYGVRGDWVGHPQEALSFTTTADAEKFCRREQIGPAHAVARLDPALLTRFTTRAPGAYQMGE
jgi:hypothetical protein